MHPRSRACAFLGLIIAVAVWAIPAHAEMLRAVQVFVSLSQKLNPADRADYLRKEAGRALVGAGHLEAVMPRTYYDTSVPDSNPAVALIQVSPGRKVVCGLPEPISREQRMDMREGAPVQFRGRLVDAHDWGEWNTLYLGDCSLHRR